MFIAVEPDARVLEKWGLEPGSYILSVEVQNNPDENFLGDGTGIALSRGLRLRHRYRRACVDDTSVTGNDELQLQGVKNIGYGTDAQLRSLYENAACFVFPSLYEGFWLPPLEALSLGCKSVVVSNRASLPEVYAGMATFCNPDDPRDIAEKILQSVRSPKRTEEEVKELQARVRRFSWNACANKVWEALQECIND